MTPPLMLSVIVVNWKVRDLLRDCLRSLQAQMLLRRDAWEVIVVDNQSGDGSVEMVKQEFPAAILLPNGENVGFAKANNQAFRICRGRYVLLLNPDTIILDHAVDLMLEAMEARPDVAVLGCRLLNTDGSFQRWTGGSLPNLLNVTCHFLFAYRILRPRMLRSPLYLEDQPQQDLEVGWVSGACMFLRREVLGDEIFDERFFMYGEDMVLCDRLIRAGWKVVYTPGARIAHHEGRSLSQQNSEAQVTKLRSLRTVFAMGHGRVCLLVYDLVVAIGFLLRWLAYGLAARVRPGRGFEVRARKSRRFVRETFRTLVRRRTPDDGPVRRTELRTEHERRCARTMSGAARGTGR